MPRAIFSHHIVLINGVEYSGEQVRRALQAARLLNNAYGFAEESGALEEVDVLRARREAVLAVGKDSQIAELVLEGDHPTIRFAAVVEYFGLDLSFVWTRDNFTDYVLSYARAKNICLNG